MQVMMQFYVIRNTPDGFITWDLFITKIHIPLVVHIIGVLLLLIIQALFFGGILNRNQFFEESTIWPAVCFIMFGVINPELLFRPHILFFNFGMLMIYSRLFRLNEEDMTNFQLYLDTATIFSFAVICYPNGVFFLPLVLLVLNQFAFFDVNRLMAFVLSLIMVLLPAWVITYLFISPDWALDRFRHMTGFHWSFSGLFDPALLYTLLIFGIALVLVFPAVTRQLTFMQNQNRKMISTMYLHLILGFLFVIVQPDKGAAINVLAIPFCFLLSFGFAFLQRRWLVNILLLMMICALLTVQWAYVLKMI